MNTELTPTEQKIAEMVHTMDILSDEMKALLPAKVNSPEFKKWRALYSYRDDLYEDVCQIVESYIKEMSKVIDLDESWKDACNTHAKCTKALETLSEIHQQDRITSEEYAIIGMPLEQEIQKVHGFAIRKVLAKEKECQSNGDNSNPLGFLS